MFAAIGRFSYRHRRLILALWLLAFLPALFATARLSGRFKGGGFSRPDSPSMQAAAVMQDRLDASLSRVSIVFASDSLDARGSEFKRLEREALKDITPATVPGLKEVLTLESTGSTELVSADGRASLALLEFGVSMDQAQTQIPRLRELLQARGLDAYITGEPAVWDDMARVSSHDLEVAERYTLPVALLVLLLIFGTLVAASMPVIGGGMAVTVTFGLLYLLGDAFDLSIFVMNSATLLGLAVGIDYSLLMVGRFREELAAGHDVAEAVEITVQRAGRAIFFSGLAVLVGLAGLITFKNMALRSIGIGGCAVVAVSVLAALTLLPAVLGMLGPRIDSLRVFGRRSGEGRFWWRWSNWVMDHAVSVLLVTVAVVLACAWPATKMVVDIPNAASLPPSAESRQGYDIIQERFDPAVIAPIDVILTWDSGDADPFATANLERSFAFGRELAQTPGVAAVRSIVNLPGVESPKAAGELWRRLGVAAAPPPPPTTGEPGATSGGSGAEVGQTGGGSGGEAAGGVSLGDIVSGALARQSAQAARRLATTTAASGTTLFQVSSAEPPTSPAGRELAQRLAAMTPPPGTTLHVAGLSAGTHDYLADLSGHFPWTIAFVVCVTYVVLLVLLRSVLLPLKAVIVNILSLLAAYGALVFVFQWGHFEWLIRFKSVGVIDADLPLLLFCGVFGISMDYEVFLLTRMREEWQQSHDNRRAVAYGLAKTGRIVTSAALIVVVVAASFAFTSILITKAMGVGLAVAVGLDATIIRILMVPALMRLLGGWNWWLPRRLERILPHVGEE